MGDEQVVKAGQQYQRMTDGIVVTVREVIAEDGPGGGPLWDCEIIVGKGDGTSIKVPEKGLLNPENWARV